MKKNIVLVCAAVMLALCLSATNALAIKDQCIELNVMWDGDNETETMIVWLDSEGWFEAVSEGGFYGYWAQYGGSFVMQAISGCEPILSGTKKRGFHECTVGDFFVGDPTAAIPPEGFNTYTIKKINKKNCLEMMKIED